MTSAIDTNVIVALWNAEETFHRAARAALDKALNEGALVISGPVYAELLAAPGQNEAFVDQFCKETNITVEWELKETVWREAGVAFQNYAARRRKPKAEEPRRILAGFLIGAHALVKGYRMLTLDGRTYQASFPRLTITTF